MTENQQAEVQAWGRSRTMEEVEWLSSIINEPYDAAIESRQQMEQAASTMREKQMNAKLESEEREEEYVKAKNNEIREMLMAKWLAEDEEYQQASEDYRAAKTAHRCALLNAERAKLLVEVGK
jgi:hypothetical protein